MYDWKNTGWGMISNSLSDNRPFSITKALDTFGSEEVMPSKREKRLRKMLTSKNFYGYIFVGNHAEKREKLKTLYKYLTEYDNLVVILNTLNDNQERAFPRSAAVFLFTVCNCATMDCNTKQAQLDSDYHAGKITAREKEKYEEINIRRPFAYAYEINERLKLMLKRDAKELSEMTHLPKSVCVSVLKNVPEIDYIDKDDVGNYLNIITDIIYSEMDEYDVYSHNIKWGKFFTTILGEQYEKDVAMYLTVESASRINKTWKNKKTVEAIWDDLTQYALETLEEMPSGDRDHMIDLYKKVVNTLAGDKKNGLRFDLTKIDEDLFPRIAESVEKCYKQLKDAVDTASGRMEERFNAAVKSKKNKGKDSDGEHKTVLN